MSPAMDQRFILEGFDPLRNVADLAFFLAEVADYSCWIFCPGMFATRAVADLAACILQEGGFFDADESPWLAIASRVTWVALLYFVRGKVFHLLLNTLK